MAEEKVLAKLARLRNDTDGKVVFMWDGVPIIFRPHEEKDLALGIAGHFVGGHLVGTLTPEQFKDNRMYVKAVNKEKNRVLDLLPLSPEQRLTAVHPLSVVEIIDPNEAVKDITRDLASAPVMMDIPQTEQPFASVLPDVLPDVGPSEEADLLKEAAEFKAAQKVKK
jgi:hypothetical protein